MDTFDCNTNKWATTTNPAQNNCNNNQQYGLISFNGFQFQQ